VELELVVHVRSDVGAPEAEIAPPAGTVGLHGVTRAPAPVWT
jgi:hypothetical protein